MPSEFQTLTRPFRRAWAVDVCCVVMAILFDVLIWEPQNLPGRQVGWTPAVLVGFLSMFLLLRSNGRISRVFWPSVLVVIAMIAITTFSTDLAILCGFLAVGRMAMACRNPFAQNWAEGFIETVCRLGITWVVMPLQPVHDLLLKGRRFGRKIRQWRGQGAGNARGHWLMAVWLIRQVVLWTIPVWVALVFLGIFTDANPILSWLGNVGFQKLVQWAIDLLKGLSVVRFACWWAIAWGSWILLRHRIRHPMARRPRMTAGVQAVLSTVDTVTVAGQLYRDIVIRTLILLNGLFLMQNLMDGYYLWGGATLPAGMTYAEYAHRGAYPLVGAALLAGVIVTGTFRSGSITERSPLARKLVYAWLFQTLILTFSAAWRLCLYIDTYSLTSLRLATLVWMGLVMAGLGWIVLRLMLRRRNGWMIRNCLATAVAALFGMSLINQARIIADFNVDHCQQLGGKVPLDLAYLYELGPQALPAELRLSAMNLPTVDQKGLKAVILRQQIELDEHLSSWRDWTLGDWLLRRKIGRWNSADYQDVLPADWSVRRETREQDRLDPVPVVSTSPPAVRDGRGGRSTEQPVRQGSRRSLLQNLD